MEIKTGWAKPCLKSTVERAAELYCPVSCLIPGHCRFFCFFRKSWILSPSWSLGIVRPELEEFEQLNTNLLIDAVLGRYSDAHSILEQGKKYLRGWTRSLNAMIDELPADIPPPVIEEPDASLADSTVWELEPGPTMNRGKANLRRIFHGNGFA